MKGLKFVFGICMVFLLLGCTRIQQKEPDLEEKYWELQKKIWDKENELWVMKQVLSMYRMDLEAQEKNLEVKYQQIPNSDIVMRLEYNGSNIDDITIGELMEDVKVERK